MTSVAIGIVLAFLAMLCWGFGDFLIQRSARKVGDWETLFILATFGTLVLSPFVWNRLPILVSSPQTILIVGGTCAILFVAALINIETLREGKLAVIEPIWSLEIPAAALLAFLILKEKISLVQIVLLALLIVFLILVAFKEKKFRSSLLLEKGVLLAFIGAFVMGSTNFFMGWGGRLTDALVINFITDAFLMLGTGIYLIVHGRFIHAIRDVRTKFSLLIPMALLDKVAWVAFVYSMVLAPIAIATALSESYIILAVLLGLFINKEKMHPHQKVGLVGAILVAVILAMITTS